MTEKDNPRKEKIIDGIHEALQDEIDSTRHREFYGEISLTLKIANGAIQSMSTHRRTHTLFTPPTEEK